MATQVVCDNVVYCWTLLESCKKVMGWFTAQHKEMLLFCVKTLVKESHNSGLACLKKKKRRRQKERHFFSFGDFLVWYSLLMKTPEAEWYIDINAYKTWRIFVLHICIAHLYYPYVHRLYQLYGYCTSVALFPGCSLQYTVQYMIKRWGRSPGMRLVHM